MYNALCAFMLLLCSPILLLASLRQKFKVEIKKSENSISENSENSENSKLNISENSENSISENSENSSLKISENSISENSKPKILEISEISENSLPKNSILARFFLYKNPPLKPCKYRFHACSLGEISSIEPFVKELSKHASVGISTITATGYEKARSFCDNAAFLPFECFLPFWESKCEVLIVFEAELWLNLFKIAHKNGAKVILLNARLSAKSLPKYAKMGFYYKEIFKNCDLVLAQSSDDKDRLAKIGAKNIKVLGNVKSALEPKITNNFSKNYEHIIVLASSHEGEESGFLEHFELKNGEQLIIAPRHPQRFESVLKLAKSYAAAQNKSFASFSELGADSLKAQIVMIDKIGELINIYAIADIAVLCGSFFDKIGGHNPFEPAFFGCGIVSGAFYHNQRALYPCVKGIKIAQNFTQAQDLAHEKFSSKIINKCDFDDIISILKG